MEKDTFVLDSHDGTYHKGWSTKLHPKARREFLHFTWLEPYAPHLEGDKFSHDWLGTALLLFLLEFLTKSGYKNGCGSLGWLEVRLASCNLIKFTENTNSYHIYASFLCYINWVNFTIQAIFLSYPPWHHKKLK